VTDSKIEQMVATVLRGGVLLAGSVVLVGGIYYVAAHAGELADYHKFVPQTDDDRLAHKIVAGALKLRPRSVIQLGVLLLIATPILRVAIALFGFVLERDRKYALISAIVLGLLLFSLISGSVG
jgi:uncharacterized membrane protein